MKNENEDKNSGDEYQNLGVSNTNSDVLQSSQHKLNSLWSYWYISRKEKDHNIPYVDRIKHIGNTLKIFNSLLILFY